ncbi:MAG: RICIN domain-containing protein [Parafilimonas sp.]
MKKKTSLLISLISLCTFIFQSCTKPEIKNDSAINSSDETDRTDYIISDGTYKISPLNNNSQAIALAKLLQEDSVYISIRNYSADSTNHLWHFTNTGNGYYRISNAYSGKVLSAPAGASNEGKQLLQLRYDTSDNQLWQIRRPQSNVYKFVNKATGLCVNLERNGNITERAIVKNNNKQLWTLTSVNAIYCDVDANNFFRRTEGWIASDGASSIVMNDGRVLWTMGDSHIDDYFYNTGKVYCLFQVRNAALLQPANHSWHWPLTSTLIGNPYTGFQSYFKNKPDDDHWMWPGCGVQVSGNDTVYVYNQPLRKKGIGGIWDFENDSNAVWAKIRSSDMQVVQYSLLQNFNEINFGLGFIKESDGYVYAFGDRQTFIVSNVYVARFPASNPNAPWTFWTGSQWSSNIKDIRRVSEAASNGAAVVKYGNKYICISTEFSVGCDQGSHIYAAWSSSPTGPFTTRKIFYEIPDRLQGHIPFFYTPNAHPQFQNAADELLITYDINGYGDCVNTCHRGRMDPDLYRPKAIRVPFSLIDK